MIWAGAFFDFIDGFIARALKVKSQLGKQLDSLADLVTFGVLPSFIIFELLKIQSPFNGLPYIAFLIAAFSALRLAKFNIDLRQASYFIGLPTPANAILISSFPFILEKNTLYSQTLLNPWVLAGLSVLLSILLVSEIKLMALKFENFLFSKNWKRYLLIFAAIIMIAGLGASAIPLVILLYIFLSLLS